MDRLSALGYLPREETQDGYCRIYVDDPFGNRIEFMEPLR
jgi:hypothetical protein